LIEIQPSVSQNVNLDISQGMLQINGSVMHVFKIVRDATMKHTALNAHKGML